MRKNILAIDQTRAFAIPPEIEDHIGQGYAFEDRDMRSLALDEIDVSRIQLVSVFGEKEDYLSGKDRAAWNSKILQNKSPKSSQGHDDFTRYLTEGEDYLSGESVLSRLKKMPYIRLDIRIFLRFWYRKRMIPKDWRKQTGRSTTYINFWGTIIRKRGHERCCLSLFWRDNIWDVNIRKMTQNFNFNHVAAVLPVG